MTRHRTAAVLALIAGLASLTLRSGRPQPLRWPSATPPPAQPVGLLLPTDPERPGAQAYVYSCAPCHGGDGTRGPAADDLTRPTPALRRDPDVLAGDRARLRARLAAGACRHVRPAQVDAALVAHLASLPELPLAPPAEGCFSGADEHRCDRCHNRDGEQLLAETGCDNCHPDAAPAVASQRHAPSLDGVGARFQLAWLQRFLTVPYNRRQHGKPVGRATRMPDFGLDEQQAADLAAYLVTSDAELPEPPPPSRDPAVLARGRALIDGAGCKDCHKLEGQGEGRMGPDLTSVGRRLSWRYLVAWLADPSKLDPQTSMPRPELDESERFAVASFLSSMRARAIDDHAPPSGKVGRIGHGMALFGKLGCGSCHPRAGVKATAPARSVPLALAGLRARRAWLVRYLEHPHTVRRDLAGSMPRLRLTGGERLELARALRERAGRRYPELIPPLVGGDAEAGRALYARRDCASCHGEDGAAPSLPAPRRLRPRFVAEFLQRPRRYLGIDHPTLNADQAADLARAVSEPSR